MTSYIDSRLLAATRTRKIRNDIRGELPLSGLVLLLCSVAFGLARRDVAAGLVFGGAVLAAVCLPLPLLLRAGADLSPLGLELHGLRRRRLAWAEVQLLTAERSRGSVRVVVWTVRGERLPLRAPTLTRWTRRRDRYVDDLRAIEWYWHTYRG
ncbi:MAG TPA: hypothetical protein VHO01_14955, partial [Jatrophihabitans sp.]|nr:hypothetical protein [Jatrophihabitans sp.]